nr:hypothetical protein [Rhodococcus sp. 06-1059B-a]
MRAEVNSVETGVEPGQILADLADAGADRAVGHHFQALPYPSLEEKW